MKYVFVDTVNGGTPSNATPDTATSIYHTSSSWPANGARWSTLNAALANATVQGITDDLTVYCQGSTVETASGGSSTVSVPSGLTCASLLIQGDSTLPKWDTSKYRIGHTGSTNTFNITYVGTTTIKNIQAENTGTSTSARVFRVAPASGTATFTFDGCYGRIGGTGVGTKNAFTTATNVGFTVNFHNCIGFGVSGASGTLQIYAAANNSPVINARNSVAYGGAEGFGGASAWDVIKNCVSFNNTDDFNIAGGTISYCASDDGDGTNAVTGVTWASVYNSASGDDFTVLASNVLIAAGVGPGSDANIPSTDYSGNARSGSTTDIGASVYQAANSLTDVDTDETITTGQSSVAYTGTGLTNADGLVITTDTSVNVSATSFSATNATSGTFTAPTLAASLTAGVKFGACTFDIQDGGVSLGTLAGTFNAEAAYTVHTVTDTSQAADPGCIYYWINAAGTDVASGDQIIFDNQSGNVTMDSQGYLAFAGGVTQTTYRARDDTDNTWASGWSTINVNDIVVTDSLGSSFHNTFISTF